MSEGALGSILTFDSFDDCYRIGGVETVLTPALAIYTQIVDSNISTTLGLLGHDPNRWRPHVKTAKLKSVVQRFAAHGVVNFKCSTTLELITACEAGAADVLVAYPMVRANARRAREIGSKFPATRISALVENVEQVEAWLGSAIGLFIDVNPGMNRTGIEQERGDEVRSVARSIEKAGLQFCGLHYYDGHLSSFDLPERESTAYKGYDRLMELVSDLNNSGIDVREVITAGTPAFPCSLSYAAFAGAAFTHRVSPGTVVYCDATSVAQLPRTGLYGNYRPAALVISTVVSHPSLGRITCDAGHKTVSADAGVPTCAVMGRPDLRPAKPSEEHLPIDVPGNSDLPRIGDILYLVPRHVCPTVNNFDHALLVANGQIIAVEHISARGRESPLAVAANTVQ